MHDTTKLLQLAKLHAPYIYSVYATKKIREITAKIIELDLELKAETTTEDRKNQIINAKRILNDKIQFYQAGQENTGMDSGTIKAQTNLL